MLEKWKNTLDKCKHVGAVFMDLSKAFDTMKHKVLIAKLEAYGFSNNILLFMHSYLNNRPQRVSINKLIQHLGGNRCWCSSKDNPGTVTLQYLSK